MKICVLLTLASTALYGQSQLTLVASPPQSRTVPVRILLSSPVSPAALQWQLTYSPSDVTSVSITTGSAASAAAKDVVCAPGPSSSVCIAYGLNRNLIANGEIAVANVTLSPSVTSTSVGIAGTLGATETAAAVAIGAGSTVSLSPQSTSASLTSLSCNPSTVTPPGSANCTANFSAALPVAATLGLSSSNPSVVVPASVAAPAGAQSVTFTANVSSGAAAQAASVSAALNGATVSAVIQIGAGGAFSPIRVNAGGGAVVDNLGQTWTADTGYSTGNTFAVTSPISGTSVPALYQSERWQAGVLQYQFAAPNGSYTVNLKFAEIYFSQPGQRQFSIAINGQTVASGFDIVAAAGGPLRAVDRSFPVSVANGQVVIQFVPGIDSPKVNAIEILPRTSVAVAVVPATATLGASQTQQFSAVVTGTTTGGVTWSLTGGAGSISTTGLYTAPAVVSGNQQVTVVASSAADPTASGTAVINLTPPTSSPGASPVRINAGGPSYIDSKGQTWSADMGFSAGSSYSVASAIPGTSDSALYQSERWQSGPFQYQFSLPNGSYTVNLKFAEIYFSQPGQRRFGVAANGQTVLTDFDIAAAAGGPFRAIDRSFTTAVSNGQITIQFVPGLDNPKVNAIEILPVGSAAVAVTPGAATLQPGQTQTFSAAVSGTPNTAVTWSVAPLVGSISNTGVYTAPATLASDQRVTVTAASVTDPNASGSAIVSLVAPVAFTPIRVNAGGPSVIDAIGQTWSADTGYLGGQTFATGGTIAGGNNPTLYQTERWGSGGFQYQFAVPNGTYAVNLKFAEIYFSSPGSRRFGVAINGQTVMTEFDIVAAAGGAMIATDRGFSTVVTNGQVSIQFVPGTLDSPKVNGIEILRQ